MRFLNFLNEKYLSTIDKYTWGEENNTEIFVNPDSSDLLKMVKNKTKHIRLLADPITKKLYIFDAETAEHADALEFLIRTKELKNKNILSGFGDIVGGKIKGTDYINNYDNIGKYDVAKEMEWIEKYIQTGYTVSKNNSITFKSR